MEETSLHLVEEQFPLDATWQHCRIITTCRTLVLGAVIHKPTGKRYWESSSSFLFVDKFTATCARARAWLAHLQFRSLLGFDAELATVSGAPVTLQCITGKDGDQKAAQSALAAMAHWQNLAVDRLWEAREDDVVDLTQRDQADPTHRNDPVSLLVA